MSCTRQDAHHDTRLGGRYLLFRLGDEHFGLSVACITLVRRLRQVDLAPRATGGAAGHISVRGRAVPMVDLHQTLRVGPTGPVERPVVVVVVHQQHLTSRRTSALVVDAVLEIRDLAAEQIQPAPRFGATGDADRYLVGTVRGTQRGLRLLDLDRALAAYALNASPLDDHHRAQQPTSATRRSN